FPRSFRSRGPCRQRSSCSEAGRVIKAELDVQPCFDRCAVGDGEHRHPQETCLTPGQQHESTPLREDVAELPRHRAAKLACSMIWLRDCLGAWRPARPTTCSTSSG